MMEIRRADLLEGTTAVATRGYALAVSKRVLEMFLAYPMVKPDEARAGGIAQTYASVLSGMPVWAIEAGILDVQRRNNPFPPSAGELRAACEKHIAPFQTEAGELRKILDARVYLEPPAEDRAAIKGRLAGLLKELGEPRVKRARAAAERKLETIAATESEKPVTLSDEARARFFAKHAGMAGHEEAAE